jgi:heptosyltransferase-2
VSSSPARILVIKLADLGDALTATPALRALRTAFPRAQVDILTSPAGAAVLGGLPGVANTIVADRHLLDSPSGWLRPRTWRQIRDLVGALRRGRYDALLLMHHLSTPLGTLKWRALVAAIGARSVGLDNGRGGFLDVRVEDGGFGALHEVQYGLLLAGALGATCVDTSLEVPITDAARATAQSLLALLGGAPYAVVHPGSGGYSLARRWFPERFASAADGLVRGLGLRVVLVGGAQDGVDRVRTLMGEPYLDLCGRTDILTLAAVLEGAALFLGGDSGVMHLATAAGAPVLALFGPTDVRAWGPWRPPGPGAKPVATIHGACPQGGPCLYAGHTVGRRDGCPTRDCLQSIQVQDVLSRARDLLAH